MAVTRGSPLRSNKAAQVTVSYQDGTPDQVVKGKEVAKVVMPDGPTLALIRNVWAPDVAALGPIGADAYVVREYRQMEPGGARR